MRLSHTPLNKDFQSVYMEPQESPVAYQRDAFLYWQKKCGDRFAPSWSDISLLDFASHVIPVITVTDIDVNTNEVTYRFWGTQMTTLHGADYTGRSVADVLPVLVGNSSQNAYEKLIQERAPHLEIKEFYSLSKLRGHQIILRMPLSDDGQGINHALTVTYSETAGRSHMHSDFFAYVLPS